MLLRFAYCMVAKEYHNGEANSTLLTCYTDVCELSRPKSSEFLGPDKYNSIRLRDATKTKPSGHVSVGAEQTIVTIELGRLPLSVMYTKDSVACKEVLCSRLSWGLRWTQWEKRGHGVQERRSLTSRASALSIPSRIRTTS